MFKTFLVLNGVGVTYKSSGNIFIHLPNGLDLKIFGKPEREFSGQFYPSKLFTRKIKTFEVGQNLWMYDYFLGGYCPSKVSAVFKNQDISGTIKPTFLLTKLDGLHIEDLRDFTSPNESPTYTRIIWSLFKEAFAADSWEVSIDKIVGRLGSPNLLAVEIWLKDLINAGLVYRRKDSLSIENPLIFLVMHNIDKNHPIIETFQL